MTMWLRRMRGAVGTGLTWAVIWAVAGVLIGVSSNLLPGLPWNSFFEIFDAPLPALAIPGFVAGALFSVVLSAAGRKHRFEELSMPQFAAWGALGGLVLSLIPAAFVRLGAATANTPHSLWQVTAVISGPFIVLSSLSAVGSLLLARRARIGARDPERDVTGASTAQIRSADSFSDRSAGVDREESRESRRSQS